MTFRLSTFRPAASLAAAAALAALPLAGQTGVAAFSSSCAAPVVLDAATLPVSSAAVDTRALGPDAAAPAFPCYAKLVLPGGGQAPPTRLVWLSFTPRATGMYRIDTLASTPADFDTILGVYTGDCGSLAPVSGVCGRSGFYPDDAPGSLHSSVTLLLTEGTEYTIAAGGIGSVNAYTGAVDPSAGGTLKVTVSRAAVAYPYTYLLPYLARGGGVASDLSVTNLEGADGQFLAQYLTHGADGEQTMPAVQPVAPPQIVVAGGTRFYPDVLGLFGYASDWGPMLIQSTRRLLVGARAYSAASGGGTVGSFTRAIELTPGVPAPEALSFGETGRFFALREDAASRTSLLFANASPVACALGVEVRDAAGALLGSARTLTVPPATAIQKARLKDTFAISGDVKAASVVVKNTTPGCAVAGVAYVVDGNTTPGSNDGYAVSLRK